MTAIPLTPKVCKAINAHTLFIMGRLVPKNRNMLDARLYTDRRHPSLKVVVGVNPINLRHPPEYASFLTN